MTGSPPCSLDRTALTYRLERRRAITNGIMEMAGSTFLLLIAVRWLEAGALAKAMVAAGGSAGLLISPLVVWYVARRGWPVSWAASRLAAIGGGILLLVALFPILPVFVAGSMLAMMAVTSAIPLMTQIYQENYPAHMRGRMFSRTIMIRIATGALFAEFAGWGLSVTHSFRWLLVVFAADCAWASYCLGQIPSQPLINTGSAHPLRALRYVKDDRLFRHTLVCWMLMGIANLMMLPLRIEYLANPKYNQHLDVATVAMITAVVPNLARLAMSPVWGWLFDRLNFFALRVVLNLGFALGIFAFFTSNTFDGMLLGAVIYGMSVAGGDVAWSLWVTKFAPPERVADYMSVHTFFTGVRGVIAPLLAFHLVAHYSVSALAWLSVALILLSSALLLPELKFGRGARPASILVDEVSE